MIFVLHRVENMVGKGIFSFSHNVFYQSQKEFLFFSDIYFVVCKCFEYGPVENFVVW